MSETELKFVVDKATARKLRSRLRSHKAGLPPPVTKKLRSIYFDTPNQALHNAGYSVRLRLDGQKWIQTVKTRVPLKNGLSQVDEFECDVPDKRLKLKAVSDKTARKRLDQLIDGNPLKPVCETVIKRTAGLVSNGNGTTAEVAIDRGKIIAGTRSVGFCEAEIELRDGEIGSLYGLAADLITGHHFAFSRLSKSDRGYLLAAEGRIDETAMPRSSAAVALSPDWPVAVAQRDVLHECLDQISKNIEVVNSGDDPEGPHQLRIGLRRLRCALSIFRPVMDADKVGSLEKEAKWLGRKVGPLRDRDVAVQDIIVPHMRAFPAERGFDILLEAVVRDATLHRKKVRKAIARRRTGSFLLDLARISETVADSPCPNAPATAELANAALTDRWNDVVAIAGGIERLTVDQRHDLRKKLKQLRYTAEFSLPLYQGERGPRFIQRLKKLQDIFGDLNDAAMIGHLFDDDGVPGCEGREAQHAIGLMIGNRLSGAKKNWKNARKNWRKLEAMGPFWE